MSIDPLPVVSHDEADTEAIDRETAAMRRALVAFK